MLEISLGDRRLGLDRMHEALHGLGQRLVDEPDLADRGDVIMGDCGVPQNAEQVGRRIALYRLDRAARELLDEVAGGATLGVRAQQSDRLDRALLGDSGSPPAARRGGRDAPRALTGV